MSNTKERIEAILEEITQEVRPCYQCGTCSAGCPVFLIIPDRNPRLVVEALQSGVLRSETMFKNVFKEDSPIWYCGLCLTCSERCPQGVDLPHLFIKLRNLAILEGKVPKNIRDEVQALCTYGGTQRPSRAVSRRREKMGLPEIPEPSVDEITKLLEITCPPPEKPKAEDKQEVIEA